MKDVYIVQPYRVGSTTGKSLAVIIPAQVVKEYKIDISTMLALRTDERREKITVRAITELSDNFDRLISTGESFEASNQQISSSGDQ
jgi:antitoxin component of MazEF toxin-antitoxin module